MSKNDVINSLCWIIIEAASKGYVSSNDLDFANECLDKVQGQPNTGLQADLSVRGALPLNQRIPDEPGGAFFVHWSCGDCLPDDYDDSDTCSHCGKPRTTKTAAAKA